jgi:hypothetical protein
MSVELQGTTVHLSGPVRVEDAEPLAALLQADRNRSVDLTQSISLHTAIVQVLLAFEPRLIGSTTDPFVQTWLTPLFRDGGEHHASSDTPLK